MGEATHWIDNQPQSAADLIKETLLIGRCSNQQSDFDSSHGVDYERQLPSQNGRQTVAFRQTPDFARRVKPDRFGQYD
jgi:hypothetical protein